MKRVYGAVNLGTTHPSEHQPKWRLPSYVYVLHGQAPGANGISPPNHLERLGVGQHTDSVRSYPEVTSILGVRTEEDS